MLTRLISPAHMIQNPTSDLAQSCCALRSLNRWAVTGTSIQNKLMDFASLVKFLGVYPYSEPDTFNHEILQPWRRGMHIVPLHLAYSRVLG